ncbi:DnaA/Hda family protein [Collinsella sp. An307]|uniref:DnaA ATPase domain-containing protein n=1 Tax=Collinsella sp. An307 TaxID=1965630 RepID=UPI000B36A022|nr:DnaA/Hda family protein [Collinsella sp. An307]OUO20132.1 chromosomal replication initiator DnaA [Collinsella sp. An307]
MENEAQMILDDTISFCERDGVDTRLVQMLRQSRGVTLTDTTLTIEAPSRFAGAALMKQRAVIERYLEEIAFAPVELVVTTALPAAEGVSRETSAAGGTQAAATNVGTTAPVAAAPVVTAPTAAAPVPAAPAPAVTAPTMPAPAIHIPSADGATSDAETHVTVTNTISSDDFKRLMSTMGQGGGASRSNGNAASGATGGAVTSASASPAASNDTYPAVPINSKFTFENFVYGDENKHAYNSAVRFAVTAEDPGSYSSLFIYGKSGLGKTHLLLAIKNYLNENCPHLKVKYANSQAYIDDFINEVALQKDAHRAILRDYHDADVLIIDDIQNIIGKTASIDNFFSLMDEFIRDNKKVAIASDRAPKNLGMDERLTSRFNAGMLCLVSEPGFEMKFMILKHYYENTVLPAADSLPPAGGDTSLLSSIRTGGGHLTEEDLKHMASVSGTNIRELESFCERCAGESFEREQEGRTLTGDDIDRIANEYFDAAHKKISVETVQKVVEDFYRVSHNDLIGPRRQAAIKNARHVAVYLALDMCEMTTSMVGAAFGGRDHTTVLHSVKVIEKRMKEDRAFVDDLQQLRNKIILRS